LIRDFLEKKLRGFFVSSIEIERGEKMLKILVETSRPGMIIGRQGDGASKLRNEIISLVRSKGIYDPLVEIRLDIKEIKSPESNSAIVAQMVAEGLGKRLPFRRVLKQMVEKVMANRDVEGVKITLSGRLGGATIARSETKKLGRIPLQTFRADVDYARQEAKLPYGNLGIKVWIYKGEVFSNKQEVQ